MMLLSIVGARPQFVKLSPIDQAAREAGIHHVIVHTGQHYDPMLSEVFFSELGISEPAVHLGVGSGSHGMQTGRILEQLDPVLSQYQPDFTLVYGDTNSTLAGAVAAVKLHLPVAHLEAGLRSFNRKMPEEINRILTDHAADLLLAPTQVAYGNLADEGLAERTRVVGDVMTDVLYLQRDQIRENPNYGRGGPLVRQALEKTQMQSHSYLVATIHRAENTDDENTLRAIISALQNREYPVILPVHPRLRAKTEEYAISLEPTGSLLPIAPLAYRDLIAAVMGAKGVITDSGGLQKEAFLLRVPCVTLREQTEWVETVELGWNTLATPDTLSQALTQETPGVCWETPYGDGHAAQRVMETLLEFNH